MKNETNAVSNPLNEESVDKDINRDKWCLAYYAGAENPSYSEKAAMLLSAQWKPGEKITISFLDGEEEIKEKVRNTAQEWVKPGMARLSFEFLKDTTDTDIRISFRHSGSWSVLGTTCRNVAKHKPTMNFGWLKKDTDDKELRRVVLHEFGHALGLIHEHMNPANGGIKWNTTQVEIDLSGPPNNWTREMIFNNMFKTFSADQLKLTRLDKDSIMMYPIPSKWTLDGFNVNLNSELSDLDKQFIRTTYR